MLGDEPLLPWEIDCGRCGGDAEIFLPADSAGPRALTTSVPAGIILSALAFGLAHSYQGFARASMISVMGAMSGVLAYWCRSVRPGMIAHALQDVLGAFIRH
jgi:Type II CAAX prenyl endopeptidase Rce1-like